MVDASWALAQRGDGTFDRDLMLGATIPQAACWWAGTAIGALGGSLIGDPRGAGARRDVPGLLPGAAGRRDGPARDAAERAARRGDRARASSRSRRRGSRSWPRRWPPCSGCASADDRRLGSRSALLAVGTVVIKAAGPVLLGGRDLPPRLSGVVARLAPALLAALVVVETFGARQGARRRRERGRAAGRRRRAGAAAADGRRRDHRRGRHRGPARALDTLSAEPSGNFGHMSGCPANEGCRYRLHHDGREPNDDPIRDPLGRTRQAAACAPGGRRNGARRHAVSSLRRLAPTTRSTARRSGSPAVRGRPASTARMAAVSMSPWWTRAWSRSAVSPQPGRVVYGPDFSSERNDRDLRNLDTFGHGTHLAGLIAGRDPDHRVRGRGPGRAPGEPEDRRRRRRDQPRARPRRAGLDPSQPRRAGLQHPRRQPLARRSRRRLPLRRARLGGRAALEGRASSSSRPPATTAPAPACSTCRPTTRS